MGGAAIVTLIEEVVELLNVLVAVTVTVVGEGGYVGAV
jgi:hypothetical protein